MTDLQARIPELPMRLILVNDGSPEGVDVADIELIRAGWQSFLYVDMKQNQGKGEALRQGIQQSDASFCVFTDIDFPYTLESVEKIIRELLSGTSVAIGIKDASYYAHTPKVRKAVSQFLRSLAKTFLRIPITDTQCGLKGFDSQGREIFLKTTIKRYLADLEFIFLADRKGLSMKPITVKLREGVVFSSVNMNILLTEGQNFMKVWWRSLIGRS